MTGKHIAILSMAALLLSGCTRYVWVNQFNSQVPFNADSYACKQSAMQSAPPAYQLFGPVPYGPERIYTRCKERGHMQHCRSYVEPAPYAPPQAVDLNERARNDLYNACLSSKGWYLQPVEDPQ